MFRWIGHQVELAHVLAFIVIGPNTNRCSCSDIREMLIVAEYSLHVLVTKGIPGVRGFVVADWFMLQFVFVPHIRVELLGWRLKLSNVF